MERQAPMLFNPSGLTLTTRRSHVRGSKFLRLLYLLPFGLRRFPINGNAQTFSTTCSSNWLSK